MRGSPIWRGKIFKHMEMWLLQAVVDQCLTSALRVRRISLGVAMTKQIVTQRATLKNVAARARVLNYHRIAGPEWKDPVNQPADPPASDGRCPRS